MPLAVSGSVVDPDPYTIKALDPDPQIEYLGPQHWSKGIEKLRSWPPVAFKVCMH